MIAPPVTTIKELFLTLEFYVQTATVKEIPELKSGMILRISKLEKGCSLKALKEFFKPHGDVSFVNFSAAKTEVRIPYFFQNFYVLTARFTGGYNFLGRREFGVDSLGENQGVC